MKLPITWLVSLSLVFTSTGCSAVLRGTTQSVTVNTSPPGSSVTFEGREVADGERVLVQKQLEPPRFHVNDVPVDMRYEPDPLLLGDAGLLIVFVVPGLVAFGVDLATGAWRRLHEVQHVTVPDPPASTAARSAP